MDYSLGFGQPSPMGSQCGGPGYPPPQGGLPYPMAPLSTPGYPPAPGYPLAPGYPPTPGYPSAPGYPSSSQGYPPSQSSGYPSYPPQPSSALGYPPAASAMPGYPPVNDVSYGCPPPQNSGYPPYLPQPTSNLGYPPASNTAYPGAISGYAASAPSAPSATGYPSSAPGYPPTSSYGSLSQTPAMATKSYPSLGSFYGNSSSTSSHSSTPTSSFRSTSTQLHAVEQPTLRPYPNFDAGADAATLRKAMKGFGTDEAAIIRVLAKRTSVQRQTIIMAYQQAYGKMLISSLRSELSGDFERLVLAMMTPPAELLADHLNRAMSGLGTNEQTLVEILCTRSNKDIVSLKTAYQTKYRRPLQKDLEGDTSGHFKRLMVSMCTGARDESNSNMQMAPQLAQQLYRAGEARLGTDESEFNRILASYSYPLLRAVFVEYKKIKGKSLHDAIKSEFSGDIKNGLLAVVMSIENRPQFFAKCLHDAMAGMGTNDNALIRIIVTRAEVDLGTIKQEYSRIYGKPVDRDIRGDTSGDYKKCLIALLEG